MDLKLKGKTALVTGGSEGIGKGIALLLAKEGVDVAICARRKEPLEATAQEIAKETGRKIVAIAADLRKDAEAKNFIEQAHKALGRIDIMVNNAGSAAGGVIEHLTEDDWEKGLQLKFMGYVRCLRYALPIMVKQGGGRVVNLIGNDGVKPSYWEICPGAANAEMCIRDSMYSLSKRCIMNGTQAMPLSTHSTFNLGKRSGKPFITQLARCTML